jgi:SET domain-containing protein
MMLVRCRPGPSSIEGLGLFALEPVTAGQPVWRLQPDLDRLLPLDAPDSLPAAQQEFLGRHAYFDARHAALVLCCDDARFMNHADDPNVSEVREDTCVALRDIAPGEEFTCNYHQLDPRPMRFEPRAGVICLQP